MFQNMFCEFSFSLLKSLSKRANVKWKKLSCKTFSRQPETGFLFCFCLSISVDFKSRCGYLTSKCIGLKSKPVYLTSKYYNPYCKA